jgi:hypothetical protein
VNVVDDTSSRLGSCTACRKYHTGMAFLSPFRQCLGRVQRSVGRRWRRCHLRSASTSDSDGHAKKNVSNLDHDRSRRGELTTLWYLRPF